LRPVHLNLPIELENHTNGGDVAKSPAFEITTYRKLVEFVARLAFQHKDRLLFFRGQGTDFQNKVGASTFYPTIYRGEYVLQDEIKSRFRILDECCRQLRRIFQDNNMEGEYEVSRKVYVQWSILQHYQVCDTPLLDFTHSLRVACSFAQEEAVDREGYVYVFGLPYITNRISINSEEELANVRLLSICPPQALRPYFQDGYLCGTTDILWEYQDKTELDFNLRLIAKLRIPRHTKFWGAGFQRIPHSVLFQRGDKVEVLCNQILPSAREELFSDELGTFIREWSRLESTLTDFAQSRDQRVQSALRAIDTLERFSFIDKDTAKYIHDLRKFRNRAVHDPESVDPTEIIQRTKRIREARKSLQSLLKAR
jgi:hypothetical protein